jgi:hypothetical protein
MPRGGKKAAAVKEVEEAPAPAVKVAGKKRKAEPEPEPGACPEWRRRLQARV